MYRLEKNWRKNFSFKKFFKKLNHKKKCPCPICNNDLVSSNSYLEGHDIIKFRCVNCKTDSKWVFEAPVPFVIHSDMDELMDIYQNMDIELGSAINRIEDNHEVLKNMSFISKQLQRMKEILDKY